VARDVPGITEVEPTTVTIAIIITTAIDLKLGAQLRK
jgi:hypothetical protein